jgi:cytochrome P450
VGGEEWKDMRSMFSPIFTSGKMKSMMTFIHDVSDQLIKAIDVEVDAGNEIELKKLFGKFSMDSIASCAFGVNASSFKDDSTVFVKNAKEIFR